MAVQGFKAAVPIKVSVIIDFKFFRHDKLLIGK